MYCIIMNNKPHQDWVPVVITKSNPNKNVATVSVAKQHINNQTTNIKVTKTYDPLDPDAEPEIKPVMIEKSFGQQVQQLRCARKMTQQDLATAISIPVSIINEYERGQGVHNNNYILKIKKYLGITKNM